MLLFEFLVLFLINVTIRSGYTDHDLDQNIVGIKMIKIVFAVCVPLFFSLLGFLSKVLYKLEYENIANIKFKKKNRNKNAIHTHTHTPRQ